MWKKLLRKARVTLLRGALVGGTTAAGERGVDRTAFALLRDTATLIQNNELVNFTKKGNAALNGTVTDCTTLRDYACGRPPLADGRLPLIRLRRSTHGHRRRHGGCRAHVRAQTRRGREA
jgi:hypothetical protein